MPAPATSPPFSRAAIVVLTTGALILFLTVGIRQTLGIFQTPIAIDLGIGRQAFGLAIALQNLLWGIAQPVVGAIADRFGPVRVTIASVLLYSAGLALASVSSDPLGLSLTLGVFIGLALSGSSYVTVLGAVGRVVPAERRSVAFGLCIAAGSFGMFAMVPGAQAMLDGLGWRQAMVVMAIAVSALAAVAIGLSPGDGRNRAALEGAGRSFAAALSQALTHRGYWLLNAGFFVCGFQIAFVATHLPAYLADSRLPIAASTYALAMIGLCNVIGSYAAGLLGARFRQKHVLAAIYLARAAILLLFLTLPPTPLTAMAFGAGIGLLWLGTVPLTSGLVARLFGVQHLSMLYGIVFMFHQLGAFLGAWGGGAAYDLLGSYDAMWLAAIALGLFAAVIHLPIRDGAAAEPRLAPA